jgi:hypothetical protein
VLACYAPPQACATKATTARSDAFETPPARELSIAAERRSPLTSLTRSRETRCASGPRLPQQAPSTVTPFSSSFWPSPLEPFLACPQQQFGVVSGKSVEYAVVVLLITRLVPERPSERRLVVKVVESLEARTLVYD